MNSLRLQRAAVFLAASSWCLSAFAAPETQPTTAPTTQIDGLTVGPALMHKAETRTSRAGGTIDSVELQIVKGDFERPAKNESGWTAIAPDNEGKYEAEGLPGGWCYIPVDSPDDRVMLMTALGDVLVYVNGEPRAGDIYYNGYMKLPVQLHKGRNDLLFAAGRGELRLSFESPRSPVMFNNQDVTGGDLVAGKPTPFGVVVINATTQPVEPIIGGDGRNCATLPRQTVPAMSLRKIAIDVIEPESHDKPVFNLTLDAGEIKDSTTIGFTKAGTFQKKTFISSIDNSVQYFTVVPATQPVGGAKLATVLSLHGASVEATNQAGAYSPKSWCDIVCPTNRRPYGFDWEDWGRTDAIEVLDLYTKEHADKLDPTRVYLTGHSMGGHGTWQVGSWFPDRFAAIGPSAGWLSFDTYAAARATSTPSTTQSTTTAASKPTVAELMKRVTLGSDTPQLMPNLKETGVYALHGVDDDNVPIAQARMGMKILDGFNHDHQLFEKPGVGHWWDDSDEPGAACVDWPAMFQFFSRHRLPPMEEVKDIDFRTPNPGVNGRCFWATIEQQIEPGKMSEIKLHVDVLRHQLTGATENVALLRVDCRPSGYPAVLTLDGHTFKPDIERDEGTPYMWIKFENGEWSTPISNIPSRNIKRLDRTGPFKQAFTNHMVFVYATNGTLEENAATLAKVRYDAELWYVRGNGSVSLISDKNFTQATPYREGMQFQNVILYGNADTNGAWAELLGEECPIQVRNKKITINGQEFSGDDLAVLFLRPRRNSGIALVGVVGSTGVAGTRLSHRLGYFSSGGAFPDWCVLDPTILSKGLRAAKACGYFDNEWKFDPSQSAFAGGH